MALKDAPELKPYILPNVQRTGELLGRGSFGAVEKLVYNQAACAGKKIHESLIDTRNIGASSLIKKFEQECKILKDLRYPHIVQFLGLCFFEDSQYPVIVMELLESNVEKWVTESQKEHPFSLKAEILRDTAKGLHYLHSQNPPIIHRDITARNVLLTSSMKAKIADLGNACIVPPQSLSSTLTRMPGTIPYMPPEANASHAQYDDKLDMFSFGHFSLFVIIQRSPFELLPPTYPDPERPDKILGRSEFERRKMYIKDLYMKFSKCHEISLMIEDCLHNSPHRRPSARKVIDILTEILKECKDDYLEYQALNRCEMAEKLKQYREGAQEGRPSPKVQSWDDIKANIVVCS